MTSVDRTELRGAPETAPKYNLRTIDDLEREGHIAGKVIFVRADIDVLSDDKSSDPSASIRLKNAVDTVRRLLDMGAAKVVIGGHIDRPKAQEEEYSTKNIVTPLQVMLGERVTYVPFEDTLDPEKVRGVDSRIVLLENLRFFPEERSDKEEEFTPFARKLAALADTYVSEAFAVSHRDETSVSRLPGLLPNAAGPHFVDEIRELSALLDSPKRPFVAVVGGAKIETKVPVIETLAARADLVLVGGKLVKEIVSGGLEMPPNVIVADLTDDGFDISFACANRFAQEIGKAGTVLWNGPMGKVEEKHEFGTMMIAQAIAHNPNVYSVLGGGDTVDFVQGRPPGLSRFSFVSAGGGAMLDFYARRPMPGVEALVKAA